MEEPIPATCLNDFVFCPASIYFHRFYDGMSKMAFQDRVQIDGTASHESIDNNQYSTSKDNIKSFEPDFRIRIEPAGAGITNRISTIVDRAL